MKNSKNMAFYENYLTKYQAYPRYDINNISQDLDRFIPINQETQNYMNRKNLESSKNYLSNINPNQDINMRDNYQTKNYQRENDMNSFLNSTYEKKNTSQRLDHLYNNVLESIQQINSNK